MYILRTLVIILIPTALISAVKITEPACESQLRVLILSGKNNHAWQLTTPALREIYEKSGRFTVDVMGEPLSWNSETLKRYDVITSNWTNFPSQSRDWGIEQEDALLDFIRSGGGFVLFHAAGACFPAWQEYQDLIGAGWVEGTGHGAYHEFKVRVEDAGHPITKDLRDFTIVDELWHRMSIRPSAHVLLRAFSDKGQGGTGLWEPAAVCTNFGTGRCFYLILGHDVQTMTDPDWQALMLRGSEWAATGDVSIGISGKLPPEDVDHDL
jgi:type 1 glutamine amidotransferase